MDFGARREMRVENFKKEKTSTCAVWDQPSGTRLVTRDLTPVFRIPLQSTFRRTRDGLAGGQRFEKVTKTVFVGPPKDKRPSRTPQRQLNYRPRSECEQARALTPERNRVTLLESFTDAFRTMPAPVPQLSREHAVLERCQESLGYRFRRPELLRAALTHSSVANTRQASNERMEFLGDSVLGLVTCERLYSRFPEYQEGDLTKVKSVVVSRKTCAEFSRLVDLGEYLFLGKGWQSNGEMPPNMLADVFEAVVAAVFFDGGYDAAKEFILKFVDPEIERVAREALGSNSKSQLQQVAQRRIRRHTAVCDPR